MFPPISYLVYIIALIEYNINTFFEKILSPKQKKLGQAEAHPNIILA